MGKKSMVKNYNRSRASQQHHPNSRLLLEAGTGVAVLGLLVALLLGM
jgi:hypothetical protein